MDVVTLALAKKGAKQYTDTVINNLPKGVVYKGSVNYYNDLPNNANLGDCYTVLYTGTSGTTAFGAEYVWGTNTATSTNEWTQIGQDLTGYVKNTNYATSTVGGVVRPGNSVACSVDQNGLIQAQNKTYAQYTSLGNTAFIGKGTLENVFTGKNIETANNKTTSLSDASTDTQYPSAKCVYDLVGNVETLLTNLDTGNGVE